MPCRRSLALAALLTFSGHVISADPKPAAWNNHDSLTTDKVFEGDWANPGKYAFQKKTIQVEADKAITSKFTLGPKGKLALVYAAKQHDVMIQVGDAKVLIKAVPSRGAVERYDAVVTRERGTLKLAGACNGVALLQNAPTKLDDKQADAFLTVSILATKAKGGTGSRDHNAVQEPIIAKLTVTGDVQPLAPP